MCCLLFYSTDYYDVIFFKPGVIEQGALCYASMGSYGLDTKTTLSFNDITAITPEMTHASLCIQLSSFSVYACYFLIFNIYLLFLTACCEQRRRAALHVNEKRKALFTIQRTMEGLDI